MPLSHIIWDFNGTIVDDVGASIDSLNVQLKKRNLPTVDTREKYYSIFGFPIIDYYRRAGFDFSKEPYEKVAVEWVEEYNRRSQLCPVRKGMKELFAKVKEMGLSQIILSATELSMLKGQVTHLGLDGVFDGIYGLDNIYAESKVSLAQNWAESTHHDGLLVVGDTEHDFAVAQKIGADCILMMGGHQSEKNLSVCGCPIVHSPEEILEYIKKEG